MSPMSAAALAQTVRIIFKSAESSTGGDETVLELWEVSDDDKWIMPGSNLRNYMSDLVCVIM